MFQLTRPARVATARADAAGADVDVSTHATRTGRDFRDLKYMTRIMCFNSRDPHGSRQNLTYGQVNALMFQLTRPARVATGKQPIAAERIESFNSRDPHGSRQVEVFLRPLAQTFQLTRPARVATQLTSHHKEPTMFQLTRPARVATSAHPNQIRRCCVSTHATRTGRDPPAKPTNI